MLPLARRRATIRSEIPRATLRFRIPYAALLIIAAWLALNLLALRDETAVIERAAAHYHASDLAAIETAQLLDYLREIGLPQQADRLTSMNVIDRAERVRQLVDLSPHLQDRLWNTGTAQNRDAYRRWQENRTVYDALIARSVLHQFGLPQENGSFVQWLTHPFLNADAQRLWLHAALLLLLAVFAEAALASWTVFLSSLIGAMMSAIVIKLTAVSPLGLITGGDGIVAAYAGLVIGLFGLTGVRTTRSHTLWPILAVLPWVGWVVWQLHAMEASAHAYAIAAAASFGAALGAGLRRTTLYRLLPPVLEPPPPPTRLELAQDLLREGRVESALLRVEQELAERPHSTAAWRLKYRCTAASDDRAALDAVMEEIAQLDYVDPDLGDLIANCFTDYLKRCGRQPRLSSSCVLRLANRFLREQRTELATTIIRALPARYDAHPKVRGLRQRLADLQELAGGNETV